MDTHVGQHAQFPTSLLEEKDGPGHNPTAADFLDHTRVAASFSSSSGKTPKPREQSMIG